MQYSLTAEEQFQVQAGDKIGWTNEDEKGPVSYDVDPAHRVVVYETGTDFPVVDENYSFTESFLTIAPSIGFDINTGTN